MVPIWQFQDFAHHEPVNLKESSLRVGGRTHSVRHEMRA